MDHRNTMQATTFTCRPATGVRFMSKSSRSVVVRSGAINPSIDKDNPKVVNTVDPATFDKPQVSFVLQIVLGDQVCFIEEKSLKTTLTRHSHHLNGYHHITSIMMTQPSIQPAGCLLSLLALRDIPSLRRKPRQA